MMNKYIQEENVYFENIVALMLLESFRENDVHFQTTYYITDFNFRINLYLHS